MKIRYLLLSLMVFNLQAEDYCNPEDDVEIIHEEPVMAKPLISLPLDAVITNRDHTYAKIKIDYKQFIYDQIDMLTSLKKLISSEENALTLMKMDIQIAIEDLKVKLNDKDIVDKNLPK